MNNGFEIGEAVQYRERITRGIFKRGQDDRQVERQRVREIRDRCRVTESGEKKVAEIDKLGQTKKWRGWRKGMPGRDEGEKILTDSNQVRQRRAGQKQPERMIA